MTRTMVAVVATITAVVAVRNDPMNQLKSQIRLPVHSCTLHSPYLYYCTYTLDETTYTSTAPDEVKPAL
jgi:hypothetical protein